MVPAIEALESCLGVDEPDTRSHRAVQVRARHASAVVPDDQVQMLIFLSCLDRDEPRAAPWLDTVADGVLDQRLKKERRNQGFLEFIRNALFQSKSFTKTLLLNAEIGPNEIEPPAPGESPVPPLNPESGAEVRSSRPASRRPPAG